MDRGLDGWETAPVRGGVPSSQAATPSCNISGSSKDEVAADSRAGEGPLPALVSTTTTTTTANNTAPMQGGEEVEEAEEAAHNPVATATTRSLVYVYTQLYCGFCSRYVTDIGGLVSAPFAAAISEGEKPGPGADMLRHLPDCFRQDLPSSRPRSGIVEAELEKGPHGLGAAARHLMPMEPLAAMTRDPRLPRLFLQPWLCFH